MVTGVIILVICLHGMVYIFNIPYAGTVRNQLNFRGSLSILPASKKTRLITGG